MGLAGIRRADSFPSAISGLLRNLVAFCSLSPARLMRMHRFSRSCCRSSVVIPASPQTYSSLCAKFTMAPAVTLDPLAGFIVSAAAHRAPPWPCRYQRTSPLSPSVHRSPLRGQAMNGKPYDTPADVTASAASSTLSRQRQQLRHRTGYFRVQRKRADNKSMCSGEHGSL